MKRIYLFLAATLLGSNNGHSADIATDVRAGSGGYNNNDGGYFEFGVGLNLSASTDGARIRTDVLLAGAYRFRGFFLEAINPGVSSDGGVVGGLTFGVNLLRNDQWALDLLGASTTTGRPTGRIGKVDYSDSENPESDRQVFERDSFYSGAGVRLTGYFGNTIFQFRLVDDYYDGSGITSSARIGYSRQVRNWNFHGVASVDHASQETSQYWYGVSSDEASGLLPQFDVSTSTISYSAEIGATYPVRENLVFRSTARYTQLDDKVTKSPLQDGDFRLRWNTSLSYVF